MTPYERLELHPPDRREPKIIDEMHVWAPGWEQRYEAAAAGLYECICPTHGNGQPIDHKACDPSCRDTHAYWTVRKLTSRSPLIDDGFLDDLDDDRIPRHDPEQPRPTRIGHYARIAVVALVAAVVVLVGLALR